MNQAMSAYLTQQTRYTDKDKRQRRKAGKGYSQQSQCQITMDSRFQRDLDLEVKIQPQLKRIALATIATTTSAESTSQRVASNAAQRALGAADEVIRRLADVTDGERVAETPSTAHQR